MNTRRTLITALALADLVVAPLLMGLAMLLRYGAQPPLRHTEAFFDFFVFIAVFRVAAAAFCNAYDFKHRLSPADHVFSSIATAVTAALLTYGTLLAAKVYYQPEIQFSRIVAVFDVALMVLWFAGSRALMLRVLLTFKLPVRAVLIGPQSAREELETEIRAYAPRLFHVHASIEFDAAADRDNTSFAGAHQAVFVQSDVPGDNLRSIVDICNTHDVDMYLVPESGVSLLGATNVTNIAGVPILPLGPPLSYRHYRYVKRSLDLAIALPALFLLLPLCAVLVLLNPRGHRLFYTQQRIGHRGREFRLVKFRSMVEGAEDNTGPLPAVENDPRITPLGRRLRKTRLDELPQLWNVVRGDMSLVGPRPERPEYYGEWAQRYPLYEQRSVVRPGMTGLAQIHGRYDTDIEQKLRYDLIYINSLAFTRDLRILLATIRVVLTGKGAM